MQQFFVEEGQILPPEITILGGDHNHIKNVLRMRPGERIRISTGTGRNYFAQISRVEQQETVALIEGEAPDTELPCSVTLYQGIPKGDKLELIIQKATELGVRRIVPVAMRNCVSRPDERKAAKKRTRWQAIAKSAAAQAKRSVIPEVALPMPYASAMAEAAEKAEKTGGEVLLPYENAEGMGATREALGEIGQGSSVSIFVGPEGGFDPAELEGLPECVRRITLGKRILRTETAGPALLAMIGLMIE